MGKDGCKLSFGCACGVESRLAREHWNAQVLRLVKPNKGPTFLLVLTWSQTGSYDISNLVVKGFGLHLLSCISAKLTDVPILVRFGSRSLPVETIFLVDHRLNIVCDAREASVGFGHLGRDVVFDTSQ